MTIPQAALADGRTHAVARAKVAKLEEQLREARAALKGGTTVAPKPAATPSGRPPVGVDSVALDAWCQENGKPWRKFGHGRPTNALIEEFRAATEGVAS